MAAPATPPAYGLLAVFLVWWAIFKQPSRGQPYNGPLPQPNLPQPYTELCND